MPERFFPSANLAACELGALQRHQHDILTQVRTFIQNDALATDLYQVEKNLFRMMLLLGKAFLGEVLARHGSGRVAEVVVGAGQRLPYQGNQATTYLSIFGEVAINRAYYWKKGWPGVCPLDARINLPARRYSYLLDDWTQSAIVEEPYDKVVERFETILGIKISKLGREAVAREAGGKFDAFYQGKPAFDQATEGSHIGIEADCKGVRMIAAEKPAVVKEKPARRGKGEKSGGLRRMAVATADFTFNPQPRTVAEMVGLLMRDEPVKPPSADTHNKRRALNTIVAASMAGKQPALEALLARVRKRDPCAQKKIIVLMDGEPALEEQMNACLQAAGMGKSVDVFILDIMHAMEYLWDVGTSLYGEKSRARTLWVRKHATDMLQGKIGYVIGGLRIILAKRKLKKSTTAVLHKAITYFDNHRHMMRYDYCLAAGYPIATGLIEGTCGSLIKDRADRSGSRWSSVGVQAVLNERAIVKNADWNAFWHYHMETEKKRLYGCFTIKEVKLN